AGEDSHWEARLWSHITDDATKPVAKDGEGAEGVGDSVAAAEEEVDSRRLDVLSVYKGCLRGEERKFSGNCDHCKKPGHKRSQCWILHPHLKPAKFNKEREGRAHLSAETSEAGASGAGSSGLAGESEGRALTSHHQGAVKNMDHEVIKKSDIDALIKALKESGKALGYSYTAHVLPRTCDSLLGNFDRIGNEPDRYTTFAADRMSRNESTLLISLIN
ncbi:uncharacterized protein LOC125606627, partial [Brassica napus]|uniref:uncharacterized protein LOC125606627 n=1 Tax=Brassica napus TaxID=3708 RepID=UPI00207862E6